MKGQMDLLREARSLHEALMESRAHREVGKREREKTLAAAMCGRRYEVESFDITTSQVNPTLLRAAGDVAGLVRAAAATTDKHVYGSSRPWMQEVAEELCEPESQQFILDVFWWQCILDQILLRAARLVSGRSEQLPIRAVRRRASVTAQDFSLISLADIARSSCAGTETGTEESDVADLDDPTADAATLRHRSLTRARRASVSMTRRSSAGEGSRSPSPAVTFGADSEVAQITQENASSSRPALDVLVRAGSMGGFSPQRQARTSSAGHSKSSSPSRGYRPPAVPVDSNGLHELFGRLSRGYSDMFLCVVAVAARTTAHPHVHAAVNAGRSTLSAGRRKRGLHFSSTLMELTAHNSLRDRACAYFRALLIETIATMFYKIYEHSDSLRRGMMLHHSSLRERIARTVDELMFGHLAPPGMLMWAPCTVGLDVPPTLPNAGKPIALPDHLRSQGALPGVREDGGSTARSGLTGTGAAGGSSAGAGSPLLTARNPESSAGSLTGRGRADGSVAGSAAAAESPPMTSRVAQLKRSVSFASVRARSRDASRGRDTSISPLQSARDNTARPGGEPQEWARELREQLTGLLASMDARTRLSLLMPTVTANGDDASSVPASTGREREPDTARSPMREGPSSVPLLRIRRQSLDRRSTSSLPTDATRASEVRDDAGGRTLVPKWGKQLTTRTSSDDGAIPRHRGGPAAGKAKPSQILVGGTKMQEKIADARRERESHTINFAGKSPTSMATIAKMAMRKHAPLIRSASASDVGATEPSVLASSRAPALPVTRTKSERALAASKADGVPRLGRSFRSPALPPLRMPPGAVHHPAVSAPTMGAAAVAGARTARGNPLQPLPSETHLETPAADAAPGGLSMSASAPTLKRSHSKWHMASPLAATSASEVRLRHKAEKQQAREAHVAPDAASQAIRAALAGQQRRRSVTGASPGPGKAAPARARRGSTSSVLSTLAPTGVHHMAAAAEAVMAKLRPTKRTSKAAPTPVDRKSKAAAIAAVHLESAAVLDVPIATASFVYSPLIMSKVGEQAGVLDRAGADAQAARTAAARHALTMRITDPPLAALAGGPAVSINRPLAGSASTALHRSRSRHSSVSLSQSASLAALKPMDTGGGVASQAQPPPTLNLYLMAQLQTIQYDPKVHTITPSPSAATMPQPMQPEPRASSPPQSQRQRTASPSITRRPSLTWRSRSLSAGGGDESARPYSRALPEDFGTFITALAEPADNPTARAAKSLPPMQAAAEAAYATTAEPRYPPVIFPLSVLSNINLKELMAPSLKPTAAPQKSETAYGLTPARLAASASVPALTAPGSRRTLSSISTVAAAEKMIDPLHEAVIARTASSLANEEGLIERYKAMEEDVRRSIQAGLAKSASALKQLEGDRSRTLADEGATKQLAESITAKRNGDFLRLHAEMNAVPGGSRALRTNASTAAPGTANPASGGLAAPSGAAVAASSDQAAAAALGLSEDDINRIQAAAIKEMQERKRTAAMGRSTGLTGSASAPDLGISTSVDTLRRFRRETAAARAGGGKIRTAAHHRAVMETLMESNSDDDEEAFRWVELYEPKGLRDARKERAMTEREKAARQRAAAPSTDLGATASRRSSLSLMAGDPTGRSAMDHLTASLLETGEIGGGEREREDRVARQQMQRQLSDIMRRRRFELGSTFDTEGRSSGVPWHRTASVASTGDRAMATGKTLGVPLADVTLIKHAVDKRRLRDAILNQRRQQTEMFRSMLSKSADRPSILGQRISGVTLDDLQARLGNLQRVTGLVQEKLPDFGVHRVTEGSKLRDISAGLSHERDLMNLDEHGEMSLALLGADLSVRRASLSSVLPSRSVSPDRASRAGVRGDATADPVAHDAGPVAGIQPTLDGVAAQ